MPFKTDEEFRARFSELFMKAEKTMKLAERVSSKASLASIQELRYAARRLVQADQIRLKAAGRDLTSEEIDGWHTHTIEACENCVKARDDAVDSAVIFMNKEVEQAVNRIGLEIMLREFSELGQFRHHVRSINGLIVDSRADRTKLDQNYSKIEAEHLDKLCGLFQKFKDNTALATALRHDDEQARIEYGKLQFQSGLRVRLGLYTLLFAIITGVISSVVGNLVTFLFFTK